jgi:hypothetical protein
MDCCDVSLGRKKERDALGKSLRAKLGTVLRSISPTRQQRYSLRRTSSKNQRAMKIKFNDNTTALKVKLVSRTHERAASRFAHQFSAKAGLIGVFPTMRTEGRGLQTLGNFHKERDGTWVPLDKEHPTCVLEVGLSEPDTEFMNGHGWIETPDSHINQAITISVCRDRPE